MGEGCAANRIPPRLDPLAPQACGASGRARCGGVIPTVPAIPNTVIPVSRNAKTGTQATGCRAWKLQAPQNSAPLGALPAINLTGDAGLSDRQTGHHEIHG